MRVLDETAETASETGARSREGGRAYLKRYVDRPSGVSAVAVEAFVNDAG
jgi:hypothetical protein